MAAEARILLVEDTPDNRQIIRELVEDWMGATYLEAADGAEGVRMARELRPDLILMDLSLPVMNGWDASRALKADPATASIPIIALTAHAMPGDEQRAREAGCDGFVTKPISIMALQTMLEGYLRGSSP